MHLQVADGYRRKNPMFFMFQIILHTEALKYHYRITHEVNELKPL